MEVVFLKDEEAFMQQTCLFFSTGVVWESFYPVHDYLEKTGFMAVNFTGTQFGF